MALPEVVPRRSAGRDPSAVWPGETREMVIAFAVALDASRRGHHAGFWALLTFIGGPFGAILYLGVALLGSDQSGGTKPETVKICPACSSRHDGAPDHCPDCGAELGPGDEHPVARLLRSGSDRYCSNCKFKVGRESNTCRSCDAVF